MVFLKTFFIGDILWQTFSYAQPHHIHLSTYLATQTQRLQYALFRNCFHLVCLAIQRTDDYESSEANLHLHSTLFPAQKMILSCLGFDIRNGKPGNYEQNLIHSFPDHPTSKSNVIVVFSFISFFKINRN